MTIDLITTTTQPYERVLEYANEFCRQQNCVRTEMRAHLCRKEQIEWGKAVWKMVIANPDKVIVAITVSEHAVKSVLAEIAGNANPGVTVDYIRRMESEYTGVRVHYVNALSAQVVKVNQVGGYMEFVEEGF